MKSCIMEGNPSNGFTIYGPFESGFAGVEWAGKKMLRGEEWWTIEMREPVPGEVARFRARSRSLATFLDQMRPLGKSLLRAETLREFLMGNLGEKAGDAGFFTDRDPGNVPEETNVPD